MDYPALHAHLYRLVSHQLHAQLGPELDCKKRLSFTFNGIPVDTRRVLTSTQAIFLTTICPDMTASWFFAALTRQRDGLGNPKVVHNNGEPCALLSQDAPLLLGCHRDEEKISLPDLPVEAHCRWLQAEIHNNIRFNSRCMLDMSAFATSDLTPADIHEAAISHSLATFLCDTIFAANDLPLIDTLYESFARFTRPPMPNETNNANIPSAGSWHGTLGPYVITATPGSGDQIGTDTNDPSHVMLTITWNCEHDPVFDAIAEVERDFAGDFNTLWTLVRNDDPTSSPTRRSSSHWQDVNVRDRRAYYVFIFDSKGGNPKSFDPEHGHAYIREAIRDLHSTSRSFREMCKCTAGVYRKLTALVLTKNGSQRTADDLVEIALA